VNPRELLTVVRDPGNRHRYSTAGSGPALVVVPGGPGLGLHYLADPLVPLLGRDHRLAFLDPPTCGTSPSEAPGRGCRFADHVEHLAEVIRALDLEEVDLLAHSFGGLVAMRHLLDEPAHRIRRLVLVDSDPAAWSQWVGFREVLEQRRTGEEAALLAEISSAPGWDQDPEPAERFLRVSLRPYFGDAEIADRLRLGFTADSLAAFRATTQAVRADLGEWDFRDELAGLATPALLIYGERTIYPPDTPAAMRNLLPSSQLEVFKGVGHFPFLEAPDAFRESVRRFLGGSG